MTIVNHQAVQNNWTTPEQILNPKTLVLGSFNPFNKNGNIVDYYYGRRSNHFWRRIAIIVGYDEEYFFDVADGNNRKLSVMSNRFCCLDVINLIELTGKDDILVDRYINDHVFTNFSDSKIFTRRAIGGAVQLTKEFNNLVIETLYNTSSIKKVIHTMGNERILTPLNVKPLERGLGLNGFSGFMNSISDVCNNRGIEFVNQSFSPSAYAVRNGATNIRALDEWLMTHLHLNG